MYNHPAKSDRNGIPNVLELVAEVCEITMASIPSIDSFSFAGNNLVLADFNGGQTMGIVMLFVLDEIVW